MNPLVRKPLAFLNTLPLHGRINSTSRLPTSSSSLFRCAATQPTKKAQRRSLENLNLPQFSEVLKHSAPKNYPLKRRVAKTLQINIGLTCNLACSHCHVESSPNRSETMSPEVANRLIELARNTSTLETVDITGGAPEMHSQFRPLVRAFVDMGISVIDRCNLTILHQEGQSDLAEFLTKNGVKIVASMPCYTPENVTKQRGDGVFDGSIDALQKLNACGYGRDPKLQLDLVYNPAGATLPPQQQQLENDYKRELKKAFDIDFNNLICITNMPIKRFADDLLVHGGLEEYMNLLINNFNESTVDRVMCLDMVHVAYDGSLFDCDFNYALDMYLPATTGSVPMRRTKGLSVFDVGSLGELHGKSLRTGAHCFGCTAGSGSSCGGSLS